LENEMAQREREFWNGRRMENKNAVCMLCETAEAF